MLPDEVASRSLRGGGALLLIAFLQRGITFCFSIALQRSVLSSDHGGVGRELEQYGAASISLEFLLSTVLFLSREPFRVALARDGPFIGAGMNQRARDSFLRTAWLSAAVGCIMSGGAFYVTAWLDFMQGGSGELGPDLLATAKIICVAAALEMLSEPVALIFQNRLVFRVRVAAETCAALVLGVSRFAFVARKNFGLLGFGYAQLLSSLTLLFVYWGSMVIEIAMNRSRVAEEKDGSGDSGKISSWFPRSLVLSKLDWSRWSLMLVITGQTAFKHLLTEGDKIVLMRAAERSLYKQGVYALAHSYGSLVARILLAPAEESARTLFSKWGRRDRQQLGSILATLLKLVIMLGALFPSFGFNYTDLLLSILLFTRGGALMNTDGALLDISSVLSWYCVYVFLLSINGMCEAFVYAVAKRSEFRTLMWSLASSFIAFGLLATPLMEVFGTQGIVITNCIGMILRIGICVVYMRGFFGNWQFARRSLPHRATVAILVVSYSITRASALHTARLAEGEKFMGGLIHIALGVLLLLLVSLIGWKYDGDSILEFRTLLAKKAKSN